MHRYRLQFERDIPDEVVEADGSVAAVAARQSERLPHTITDLTAMREWVETPRTGHPTPLRDRIMGTFDEDVPRYFAAKELA